MDYLSDKIGESYKKWQPGEQKIITCDTGFGKTHFVFEQLSNYAISQNKYLVYFCNRKSIKNQMIAKYARNNNEANSKLLVLTYQFCEAIGKFNPIIINPNADNNSKTIKEICSLNKITETTQIYSSDVLYYVFDEAHYFVGDAKFNSNTNFWFGEKLLFDNSISVFLTATPEPLYCFLYEKDKSRISNVLDEMHDKYDEYFKAKKNMIKGMPAEISVRNILNNPLKGSTITKRKKAIKEKYQDISPYFPAFEYIENCINYGKKLSDAYGCSNDYSQLDVSYFEDYDELIEDIVDSEKQWLIFVNNMDEGVRLQILLSEKIKNSPGKSKYKCPAVFLNASNIGSSRKNPDIRNTLKELNSDNTLYPKVLIATSVLDCGVSIEPEISKNLDYIVISQPEKTEFLQMLGRIRFKNCNRKIKLIMRCFEAKSINSLYQQSFGDLLLLREFYHLNLKSPKITYEAEPIPNTDEWKDDYAIMKYDISGKKAPKIIQKIMSKKYLAQKNISDFGPRINACEKKEILYLKGLCLSNTAFLYLVYSLKQYGEALFSRDENDRAFYLRKQLSWIKKGYDVKNWYSYPKAKKQLNDFLTKAKKLKWFQVGEENKFSMACLKYIYEFPSVFLPVQLYRDRNRYKNGERKELSYKKLNNTLEFLNSDFRIEKKRFTSSGVKITKWRVVLKEPEQN